MPDLDITTLAALASPAAIITVGAVGGLWRMTRGKFKSLDDKIDNLAKSIREIYDRHEERDQERHEENVQRLTRLETKVENGNGHAIKRRVR